MEKAVEMIQIVKQFPGVLANDHVDLIVLKGEIHSVVGENGAGKTTLMNQLYGLLKPDSGEIRIFEQKVSFKGPRDAIAKGIGMVHQHFMLVNNLTVAENVVLGSETTRGIIFDLREAQKRVDQLSRSYGLQVDPTAKIEDLPVGMQQRVEIIKTLYRGAEILILDEPMAVLTPQETEELFSVLRKLKENGKTIIFISHKLNEVMEISDRITVMRQGKVTGVLNKSETDVREIARLMVGREVVFTVQKLPAKSSDVVLRVENLWVKDYRKLDMVKGISFEIRKGEIYGIAGVAGNGQSELVEALTGLRKPEKGRVILCGEDVTGKSVRELREKGMAHIPEDRHKYGLILQYPAYYNMILGRHYVQPFVKGDFLDHRKIQEFTKTIFSQFDVRPNNIKMLGMNFSGGNQQKLVVAREMSAQPKLLVVSQPTRGLDVGATEFIHKALIQLRDTGVAILLVSMELDEIMSLSDRLAVMYSGQIMGEVDPKEVTVEEIGLMMAGHRFEDLRRV
ncbi:MAG TPA: ABC transporter ATP-binding protein [Pseudothermotoga sp.]|nr:ABC transporter ATP-binding protein [Pseudothermotoga sp.]